jgi:hypothetical protein
MPNSSSACPGTCRDGAVLDDNVTEVHICTSVTQGAVHQLQEPFKFACDTSCMTWYKSKPPPLALWLYAELVTIDA